MDDRTTTVTDWNPAGEADYDRLKGRTVYTSDDQLVGTIAAVFHPNDEDPPIPESSPGHYFLIEQSALTRSSAEDELYMPDTAVGSVSEDRVVVPWTRVELENQGWGSRPLMVERARRS